MTIRELVQGDAAEFQAIRLRGLREAPTAFASSYDEEQATALKEVALRLQANERGAVFGAFSQGLLRGVLGLQREEMCKLSHKAHIWGMYVVPEARRHGHGAELIQHALRYAWKSLRVRQVNLGVNTENVAAFSLYRRFGFEIYGTEIQSLFVNGAAQDEFHMVCRAPRAA